MVNWRANVSYEGGYHYLGPTNWCLNVAVEMVVVVEIPFSSSTFFPRAGIFFFVSSYSFKKSY